MTGRQRMEWEETYSLVYVRDGMVCSECDRPLHWHDGELAHRVPRDVPNLRKYGAAVLNHPLNLALVCRHSSACNDGQSISNHPRAEAELVAKIRAALAVAVEA